MYVNSIQLYVDDKQTNMALKFTKNQTLILEIFFNNPEKSYYLRELARIINKKPGVFQRDINNLVEKGILESYYRANSRFFNLNKKYPLYKEFKSIFFKTVGAEGALKKELRRLPGIKESFIYGSFAQGEEKSFSDVDVFIIGSINEDDIIDIITQLEKRINREINYILMTEQEFQKKLKEKNSFLENILNQKRIKLI